MQQAFSENGIWVTPPGRFPTDQGFDEWYGIPNSSDESFWPQQDEFNRIAQEGSHPYVKPEEVYEGKKDQPPVPVKVFDLEARAEIDREITDRAKRFIKRHGNTGTPFFAYIPYTQTHFPVTASREFRGKSGNGQWADILMQIDAYVGELVDTLKKTKASDNTIFIFTADNGPEMLPDNHGWSGPWRGSYFTAREGSLRVPFILHWPSKVPAGRVSNEIVHQMDLFTTFAHLTGAKLPDDRVIDGADQSEFFLGKSERSARESFVIYVGEEIFGVKWRNWKMLSKEFEDATGLGGIVEYGIPRFYNLLQDPTESYPVTTRNPGESLWVRWPMGSVLSDHVESFRKEPPIKPGTPDPYQPKL